jgi:hypothetical protein
VFTTTRKLEGLEDSAGAATEITEGVTGAKQAGATTGVQQVKAPEPTKAKETAPAKKSHVFIDLTSPTMIDLTGND